MKLPDFLTSHQYGEIRLTGHRIGLLHVIDLWTDGLSAEEIEEQFPSLSLALIHKVLAFYLENRADVDAYIAECHAEIERQAHVPSPGPGLAEMKRRLEAQ
jgi:uncharacterized protein (DUF433 family)